MSGDMVGGSLPEMEALKKKLTEFQTQLSQLKTASSGVVTSTTWKGKYADDFRTAWSQCEKNIGNIETDLAHASTAVEKNRQAIQTATGG
ncbi:hypothetical protein HPO96_30845 [Kribbella sandramycini]|uniref:Uncharacterized protein YukE n=1 Tax=Kribbella sandramycini TaxID=60450 RepID=A0A7Y4L5A8_9ACTN|nr:hypothetical protein [Kribbella sandramycini]MBB6566933.1 uncharacterized protein YukE [Kribbella sandramycini]NOL44655.1 hypothetical protein [Kribbella sandramycini]